MNYPYFDTMTKLFQDAHTTAKTYDTEIHVKKPFGALEITR